MSVNILLLAINGYKQPVSKFKVFVNLHTSDKEITDSLHYLLTFSMISYVMKYLLRIVANFSASSYLPFYFLAFNHPNSTA
jgi:hypothetical protein